jgi:hypothetical protein
MTAVRERMSRVTGSASMVPLLILFGLNTVDELDRSAFSLLLPEIRDHFDLDNQGALSIVTLVAVLALGLQPFVGFLADRRRRVVIAASGAAAWATFSFFTHRGPLRFRHRPDRQRPHPQLPTGGLLRAVGTPTGLRMAPRRQRHRPTVGAALRRVPGRRIRVAGTLPVLRPPHVHPRGAGRCSSPRTGSRRPRAAPRWSVGRGDRHRRGAAELRRELAHLHAGQDAAPHLVLPARPRRLHHRPGHTDLALLRGDLRPRRGRAGRDRRRVGAIPAAGRHRRGPHREPPLPARRRLGPALPRPGRPVAQPSRCSPSRRTCRRPSSSTASPRPRWALSGPGSTSACRW